MAKRRFWRPLRSRAPVWLAAAWTLGSLLGPLAAPIAVIAADREARKCTVQVGPGADLQRALDGISTGTEPVMLCLQPGEYRLASSLSITRDHVTVRGAGRDTVLRLEPGVQAPTIVIGDYENQFPAQPTSDVTIEKLAIVGNGGEGSELHPAHPYLTNSPVTVRTGHDVRLLDLDVSACRSACLLTEHDSRDVTIQNCAIHDATWDGISLNRTYRARLIGNQIRGNTAAGITVEHIEDSTIENNTIENNRSHGIYLSDSYRNRVKGNRFSGNTNAGVFLTCAVRYRDPAPVLCWDDSMSRENTFEDNLFVANRLGYIVAADRAANCTKEGFVPNLSRGDRFEGNPAIEQRSALYGECLVREHPGQ